MHRINVDCLAHSWAQGTVLSLNTVADLGIEFGGGANFRSGREFEGGVVDRVFRPDFEGGGSRWGSVNSRGGGSWQSFPARFRGGGVVDELP